MAVATLEQRIRFNERFNDDDNGGPWTLAGRDYVIDEIWRPLESYRCWTFSQNMPVEALCPDCRAKHGTLVSDPVDASPHPPLSNCPGLIGVPIVTTGANVPRRSGKTLNGTGYGFAGLFLEPFEKMAYIASAEDQSEELIEQKIASKIRRAPALDKLADVTANKITVEKNHSSLEILPASHASVTGRGFTLIMVDEARDLLARVFAALIMSLMSEHGVKCPAGHGSWRVDGNNLPPFLNCPSCGARLKRWHARLLVMSASGEIEENPEKNWFNDWIDLRIKKPDPSTSVWRTDKKINPSVSTEITNAIRRGFGDVPGLQTHLGVELDNQPMRMGESYITQRMLDNVVDSSIGELPSSTLPAVGFIDTSRTGDKTSLVICVDQSLRGEVPFARLRVAHIREWDPKKPDSCPDGVIDDKVVEEHLNKIVPRFTGLLRLKIDTRVMPWAKLLVARCMRTGWGSGRIEGFEGNALHNSAMYLELLARFVASQEPAKFRALLLFPHPELERELVALRKRDLPGGGIEVYDAGGGKDGRNRKKGGVHRDTAMSLAACCLLAAEIRIEMPQDTSLVRELDRELEEEHEDDDDLVPMTRDLVRGGF